MSEACVTLWQLMQAAEDRLAAEEVTPAQAVGIGVHDGCISLGRNGRARIGCGHWLALGGDVLQDQVDIPDRQGDIGHDQLIILLEDRHSIRVAALDHGLRALDELVQPLLAALLSDAGEVRPHQPLA